MRLVPSPIALFLSEREVRTNVVALLRYVALVAVVVLVNSVLFLIIMLHVEGERHSLITAIYWTLTTMTTLGFGDITFRTDVGRAFSTLVTLSGIMLLLILLPFMFIRFFAAPWLEARVRLRAPRELPPDTEGHVILCTYEEIAAQLVHKLRRYGIPHVVVERDPERAARLMVEGVPVVAGDVEAGSTFEAIRAAKARLIVANAADTVNTNITLTVREVAAEVPIAAIASVPDSVDILELSGCNYVLPLRVRLGEHLANRVNAGQGRAHVIGAFEDLQIAEFAIHNTPLAGRTIRDSRLREATGLTVIAVWERGRLLPAHPNRMLTPRSVPVVLGTSEQLETLESILVIYHVNENPVVVIGGGKVGRSAAAALKRLGIPVHLIEKNPEMVPRIGDIPDELFLGDAADRKVLFDAGIQQAPSVVLTTHDDAMNIYLAVYCRRLNPELWIVSRVTHERNVEAVLRAGADFVLSYTSLGTESIMAILQERELVVLGEGIDLFQVPVPQSLAGDTLATSGIGARTGMSVVAVRTDGRMRTDLRPPFHLERGSELLMIGSREQLDEFRRIFG